MKKKFWKPISWKIALWGVISELVYALSIFLYLNVATAFNLDIGSQALVLILVMIYSGIFSLVGLAFVFLFLIRARIIKRILSVASILLGAVGLIVPQDFFIPLSVFLIWAGIQAWREK